MEHMESLGVRELKTHLSRYLRRVHSGERLLITDRGRSIALIMPVQTPVDVEWAHQLVAAGAAHWNGGKPSASRRCVTLRGGRTASSVVLEDRR